MNNHNAAVALDRQDCHAVLDPLAIGRSQPAPDEPARHPAGDMPQPEASDTEKSMLTRVGQLTRVLHDSLHELGYDRMIKGAASSMPDAQDRLAYVASMTEQAAQKVLNAIDAARPEQEALAAGAAGLERDWARVFARELPRGDFPALVERTRGFLAEVPRRTEVTNAQLLEIMMAQDFQDLTGQVIKKINNLILQTEKQLLQLLLDHAPPGQRGEAEGGLLNGPVVNAAGRTDVVTNQSQVDDLLESLGF